MVYEGGDVVWLRIGVVCDCIEILDIGMENVSLKCLERETLMGLCNIVNRVFGRFNVMSQGRHGYHLAIVMCLLQCN